MNNFSLDGYGKDYFKKLNILIFILNYSHAVLMQRRYNDIIDTLCGLLKNKTTTAIFINYNDYSSTEALNSKIFLKFANELNIPVMTFIPNAYQTVR